jgi:hypothetical protein
LNCRQARALLAIQRKYIQEPTDTPELEDHLAHCADCKDAYAQAQFVGERIRSLPSIEPSGQAHQNLMQALAAEHVRFLQHTAPSARAIPAPAFLAPYVTNLAKQEAQADSLAAFSTAETGPLPIMQAMRPRRHTLKMQPFTIIGLAASFMVVVMMGGLLSLLFIANQGSQSVELPSNQANLTHPEVAQADTASAATQTLYPHIASANVSNSSIYYSAYNDDQSSWMLETFSQDTSTNTIPESTPLLTTPGTRPIIILGSNQDWLIWLQMETAKKSTGKAAETQNQTASQSTDDNFVGPWSVKALYIGKSIQTAQSSHSVETNTPTPLTLETGTFNPATAPAWVTTPIQGLSFYDNHALLALVDNTGTSDLINYQFDQGNVVKHTLLATGTDQHVLTSPAATSNGHSIYWSEEWLTATKGLSSNIWTQQAVAAAPAAGRWTPHTETQTYLYRADGLSFRPQIAGRTLFLLNKTPADTVEANSTPAAQAQQTPVATQTALPATSPASTPTPDTSATSAAQAQNVSKLLMNPTSTDPTVLTAQIDTLVSGRLLAFTADGSQPATTTLNDNALISDLQSGGSFLIWQDSEKNLDMYDAGKKVMVNGIDSIDRESTAFISVNGNTIVWTKYVAPKSDPAASSETKVTFNTIKWPK